MAAEAKAQTELRDFKSLFSLEGKVVVVVCTPPLPRPDLPKKNNTIVWLSTHVLALRVLSCCPALFTNCIIFL